MSPGGETGPRALLRVLVALVTGAFLGAAATTPLAARRVDTLTLLTTDLLRELAETENELARLREHPPEVLAPAVAEVRLELVTAAGERLPPATEVTLRRELDPVARQLVGENVYELSPAVVRELFARREVRIEETVYRLEVDSIVLGPRTVVRLRVAGDGPGSAPAPAPSGFRHPAPGTRRLPAPSPPAHRRAGSRASTSSLNCRPRSAKSRNMS